jgi:hypothetical protein
VALAAHHVKHMTKQKLEDNMKAAQHQQQAALVPARSTKDGTSRAARIG